MLKLPQVVTSHKQKFAAQARLKHFLRSVWLFPAILTLVLIILTSLRISGSSIGVYHSYFYGQQKDPALILNIPRSIRSDEWVVNTQMTIAQKNDSFSKINNNIGNGEDMSVLTDAPYKDWSEIFKPHNWSFFILPFDYAFAFKWWIMAYLLIVSCYFFVLAILPGRRLIAMALSLALLFSPFVQWWYQYATLGPIYYSLFSAAIIIHLMRQKKTWRIALLAALLAYLVTCMALVLYPPFQIPCALVLGMFTIGYLIEDRRLLPTKDWLKKVCVLAVSLVVAGLLSLTFILTRASTVHTIVNTAYPGKRIIRSGGFDFAHLLSGNLDFQLQFSHHASKYQLPTHGLTNQSENSNFILLEPFLVLPAFYLLYKGRKIRKPMDWPLLFTTCAFLFALFWLFVPQLSLPGKLLLLNKVPHVRLLIGLGLLNIMQVVLFIRRMQDYKGRLVSRNTVLIYVILVFVTELLLGVHAMRSFNGFIGLYKVILLSIPIPLIVYALLNKRFLLGSLGFLVFSIFSSVLINPIYRGTSVLTNAPLSTAIRKISQQNNGRWAIEPTYLENFAIINGARSLSGVYAYPQLQLWEPIDKGVHQTIYNRYANVTFNFDRTPNKRVPTSLELPSLDHFSVTTEPCSNFLKINKVSFLLTEVPLSYQDKCVRITDIVNYPSHTYYIYRLR